MGDIRSPEYVLLIVTAFSRHGSALSWARQRAEERWGAAAVVSDMFSFTETAYYADEMGEDLTKFFLAFEQLIDPQALPDLKLLTNEWEVEYRDSHDHPELRPLNLDPGYLTEAKLVLATTKDRHHRIYLSQGIFAEITLNYVRRQWRPHEWTYPDYRRPEYHEFFDRCREYYRRRLGKV